jgi:hypothetical protein
MTDSMKLATVTCPNCSALVELYPPGAPGSQLAGWNMRDSTLCKTPPLTECRFIRTEIERLFPGHLPPLGGPAH